MANPDRFCVLVRSLHKAGFLHEAPEASRNCEDWEMSDQEADKACLEAIVSGRTSFMERRHSLCRHCPRTSRSRLVIIQSH